MAKKKMTEKELYLQAIERAKTNFLGLLTPEELKRFGRKDGLVTANRDILVRSKKGIVSIMTIHPDNGRLVVGISSKYCRVSCAHIETLDEYDTRPIVGYWDSCAAVYLYLKNDIEIPCEGYVMGYWQCAVPDPRIV